MSSDEVKFINSQRADQWLASKFRGTDVLGTDNQQIGDVNDILFDKDGKVEAFIVSIGGFLGIGAKDVAVAPSAFQVVAGDKSKNEADKLKIGLNKEQLQQAATFEPYRPPAATTGMAPQRTGAPRPTAQ
jgi:sporulation protein YlmC with PRC-barrel domain